MFAQMPLNTMNDIVFRVLSDCIRCSNYCYCDCDALFAFPMMKNRRIRRQILNHLQRLNSSVKTMLVLFHSNHVVLTLSVYMRQLILHVMQLCDIIPIDSERKEKRK